MKLTEEQLTALNYSDYEVSLPVELTAADLSRPFVYDRKWGVFYVGNGYHQAVMSLLFAFHNGYNDRFGAMYCAEALGVRFDSSALADMYLKTIKGTLYMSTMSHTLYAGKRSNLTPSERKFFGDIKYLFESDNNDK